MILKIILLIIFLLALILLSFFTLYILIPSITKTDNKSEDPLVPLTLSPIILPEEKRYMPSENKAYVMCSCHKECKLDRSLFNPEYTCVMAKTVFGSSLDCKYACLGLGDCVKICPQNAIFIKNQTAVVSSNCIGCGKCVEICPLQIIRLIPVNTSEYTICANKSDEKSGCDQELKTQKVVWNEKKHFKIWTTCYRIFKGIIHK